MEHYIRYSRKNRSIYTWREKLYIPVMLSTKNAFMRHARLNMMSQAEFGAVVVMHYLDNVHLLDDAIAKYRAAEKAASDDWRARQENVSGLTDPGEDGTFGGVFKSSFPGDEDEET